MLPQVGVLWRPERAGQLASTEAGDSSSGSPWYSHRVSIIGSVLSKRAMNSARLAARDLHVETPLVNIPARCFSPVGL